MSILAVAIALLNIGLGFAQATPNQTPQNAPAAPASGGPDAFPEIVATVNEAQILRKDLLNRVQSVQSSMGLPGGSLPLSIYRTILDDMIGIELLYQASQKEGLEANPEEVEQEYQALKERFATEEEFEQQLTAQSISSEELKNMIRRELCVQRLVEDTLEPGIEIADADKLAFYETNKGQMQQPEQIKLRHILSGVSEEATAEEKDAARLKIEEIRREILEEGKDFAALARQYSDDKASREAGGEITVALGQTVAAFEEAALRLGPGMVSEVVETKFGYHIIRMIERMPARTITYDEVEERIDQYLKQEKLKEEIESQVDILRAEATVEKFI
jgi:peptidyl-prolyl cis-trans isomerase C